MHFTSEAVLIIVLMPQPRTTPPTPPTTMPAQTQAATEPITIGGEIFKLEIAADEPTREKGLMGRNSIAPDGGMLFIYPKPKVLDYWMANCPIDIDIIFLDAHGKIVATHKMKPEPPKQDFETQAEYEERLKTYSSNRPAQFAIELKTGTIERLKLKPGQKIAMDVERLAKLAR